MWKTQGYVKWPYMTPFRLQDSSWARGIKTRAEVFALHLSEVFHPKPSARDGAEDYKANCANAPDTRLHWPSPPPGDHLRVETNYQKPNKSQKWWDIIMGRTLKMLSEYPLRFITRIFNAILRVGYSLLVKWMTPKPGRNWNFYRPAGQSTAGAVLERHSRTQTPVNEKCLVLITDDHGFRKGHKQLNGFTG